MVRCRGDRIDRFSPPGGDGPDQGSGLSLATGFPPPAIVAALTGGGAVPAHEPLARKLRGQAFNVNRRPAFLKVSSAA